jgi:hypothetical protein
MEDRKALELLLLLAVAPSAAVHSLVYPAEGDWRKRTIQVSQNMTKNKSHLTRASVPTYRPLPIFNFL